MKDSLEIPGHPTGRVLIRNMILRCPYSSSPATFSYALEVLSNVSLISGSGDGKIVGILLGCDEGCMEGLSVGINVGTVVG
jgi:hypothetical protein